MFEMYTYGGSVSKVVDGDTVDVFLDLGFGNYHEDRLRLYGPDPAGRMGLNAPEIDTPEGKASAEYLTKLIEKQPVVVKTVKDRKEKYGRYLAVIFLIRPDGTFLNVNQDLLDTKHAALKQYLTPQEAEACPPRPTL